MKRFEQPELEPGQVVLHQPTKGFLPGFLGKLLLAEAVSYGASTGTAIPQWIVWQLPVVFLLYNFIEEHRFAGWVVRAWNRRSGR